MNFSCPSCAAKYYIADDNVVGRTLKMKCRKCANDIPIQGRATSVAPRSSERESVPPSSSTRPSAISSDRLRLSLPVRPGSFPPPSESPSLPPREKADAGARFRVVQRGRSVGPLSRWEMFRRLEEGEMAPDSFVWRPGMKQWKRLSEVSELSSLTSHRSERVQRGRQAGAGGRKATRVYRSVAIAIALAGSLLLGFALGTFISQAKKTTAVGSALGN